jgi:hypothetical protein
VASDTTEGHWVISVGPPSCALPRTHREFFGEDFSNGACLYHPTFAIAAVGVLASPLAAAALALNTPLVILPRT